VAVCPPAAIAGTETEAIAAEAAAVLLATVLPALLLDALLTLAIGLLLILLVLLLALGGLAVLRQLTFHRGAQVLSLAARSFEIVVSRHASALRRFLGALQALAPIAHRLRNGAFIAGDVEAVTAVDIERRIGNSLLGFAFDQAVIGAFE